MKLAQVSELGQGQLKGLSPKGSEAICGQGSRGGGAETLKP